MVPAIDRARVLNAMWSEMRKSEGPAGPAKGTLSWVIREYEKSDWYTDLEPVTKQEYDSSMRRIEGSPLAKHQVANIKRRNVRLFHQRISEAVSRERANRTVKVLRRLFSYAIELELIETNPALQMGLKHSQGRDQVWATEEVDAFVAKAIETGREGWAVAVRIGYDTAQRLSDVLDARWQDFDGEGIDFIQSKTSAKVWAPLKAETITLLSGIERKSISHIVTNTDGRTVGRHYFHRVFAQIRKASEIPSDLTFLDLRRTAATEIMAGGGRAEPLTGHRPGSTVLRRYEKPNKKDARASQRARDSDGK